MKKKFLQECNLQPCHIVECIERYLSKDVHVICTRDLLSSRWIVRMRLLNFDEKCSSNIDTQKNMAFSILKNLLENAQVFGIRGIQSISLRDVYRRQISNPDNSIPHLMISKPKTLL